MFVKRIFVASAVLAACALVAVNERSTRSPLALLSGDDKPLGYVKLQDAGAMGTNRAFLGKADGKGTGQRGHAGMGTNSAFMGKSDGAGQSTKAMRMQQLAAVSPQVKQVKGQAGGEAMWGISKATAAAYAAAHPAHVAPKAKKASKAKRQSKKAVRTQKLYEWDASMEGTYLPADPAYTGEGTKAANGFGNGWANSFTDASNLGGIRGWGNVLPLQSHWVAGPAARGARQNGLRSQMLADAPLDYIPLEQNEMGTNGVFANKGDGQRTGMTGRAGFGTNAVFQGKGDGQNTGMTGPAGQGTNAVFQGKESFKGRKQNLYAWDASMEGTYLPANPLYTGEGTKMANAFGSGWANSHTDASNLGGIRGWGNVLPLQSHWVAGPAR